MEKIEYRKIVALVPKGPVTGQKQTIKRDEQYLGREKRCLSDVDVNLTVGVGT
uniref:Uncharacterized protein n=1 Tax=Ciona intestinalis TaxID=7719 RepID=H2XVG2_CIOIN